MLQLRNVWEFQLIFGSHPRMVPHSPPCLSLPHIVADTIVSVKLSAYAIVGVLYQSIGWFISLTWMTPCTSRKKAETVLDWLLSDCVGFVVYSFEASSQSGFYFLVGPLLYSICFSDWLSSSSKKGTDSTPGFGDRLVFCKDMINWSRLLILLKEVSKQFDSLGRWI